MADRPSHYRQPPLQNHGDVQCYELADNSTRIYSSPGYMIFIERMWHGDYQQVPVDPETLPALIEALQEAQRFATREKVVHAD